MEEDEPAFVPKERIQFGTLEAAELARRESSKDDATRKAEGIASGNINVQDATEESAAVREKQEKLLAEFEMRRRVRAITVPVIDKEVREKLRLIGEPVTLFGEREMERRDRLRKILAKKDEMGELDGLVPEEDELEEEAPIAELFYTEGSQALKGAREAIAESSLRAAKGRIAAEKRKREDPDEDEAAEAAAVVEGVRRLGNECSEIGDERPLSGCALDPTGRRLATVAWSGVAKVWSIPSMKKDATIVAHNDRITGVAWHPQAGQGMGDDGPCLATASADHTARLWSVSDGGKMLSTLKGHTNRLGRVAFHPSGRYLGTASYDLTWRLWDVETGDCLLEQEGHSRAVYAVAFQCDGSLACSVGLDAIGRVWDLRTGRSIMTLEGHVKQVLGCDWSPNGYHVVTGSDDHMCRVWDLRSQRSLYTIPAHSNLISQVRVEQTSGHFFMSASYDNTIKMWSMKDFKLIKSLTGHEGKVMGCDVAGEGELAASTSYDRTVKLWAPQAGEGLDDVLAGMDDDNDDDMADAPA